MSAGRLQLVSRVVESLTGQGFRGRLRMLYQVVDGG